MKSFTKKKKKKHTHNNIVSYEYQLLQNKLFSQTKNYFCYFSIAFEKSHIVVILVFCVLNTKYLVFRTPNASTLILG